MKHTGYIFLILLVIFGCNSKEDSKRLISFKGKKLFLSGANIAWVDFASDIGPGNTDFEKFDKIFEEASSLGANCMRLWLHTDGTNTPEFDGYKVIGPGDSAIYDLKMILDLSEQHRIGLILCLWSFDMLRKKIGDSIVQRNKALLTVDTLIMSYIENSLVPMVDSLKNHPAIIAWEIFNEPEGMCYDVKSGGWHFNEHISIKDVQKFVNLCASAIHNVKKDLLVTNGTWSLIAATDVDSFTNYYTDERLIAAGGKENGTLDFYCLHHYDWLKVSPFEHDFEYWGWDKPVVLAEFYPQCANCGPFSNYEYLLKSGYAGALGWDWHNEKTPLIKREIKYLYDNYSDLINPDE